MRPDPLGEIDADLALDDVERRDDFDVADVVAAQIDVHEPGDELLGFRVLVIGQALHERVRAVPDSDDRDADLVLLPSATVAVITHWMPPSVACGRAGRAGRP